MIQQLSPSEYTVVKLSTQHQARCLGLFEHGGSGSVCGLLIAYSIGGPQGRAQSNKFLALCILQGARPSCPAVYLSVDVSIQQ